MEYILYIKRELSTILKIFKYMLEKILYPFYLISFLFPRDKNIWVFGSRFGQRFCDNPKYLFLYVHNNRKNEIRPIWISKNKEIVNQLKERNFESYYAYGFKGMYYTLKAKYHIFDFSLNDINFWLSGGAIRIQLWHGIPLKKIENDSKLFIKNRSILHKGLFLILQPWLFIKNSYVICPSDSFVNIFSSAFGVTKKEIIISGNPRNDILFNNIRGSDIGMGHMFNNKLNEIKLKTPTAKIILYMPTFRDTGGDVFSDDFNLEKLNQFLIANNAFFIVKTHPNALDSFKMYKEETNKIIFLPDDFDVYPILPSVDILVTDYSSIFFDFLLLSKPIIFFPYDINKYASKDRELYFDYNEFVPGPKASTFDELLCVMNYFLKGNDGFLDQRKKTRDFAFKYVDGKSAEIICNFIVSRKF